MSTFKKEYDAIIAALEKAKKSIESVNNSELAPLKARINTDLTKHITALKAWNGDGVITEQQSKTGQPLRKILGREIPDKKVKPEEKKPLRKTPEDVAYEELQARADELYDMFISAPSDDIMDSVTELEIRAVAKKAGMPVTDEEPKKITTKYVDDIKAAIQKQTAVKEAGNVNNGDQNENQGQQ